MFGGLGVGIDRPNTVLEAQTASDLKVSGQETELVTTLANRFFTHYKVKPKAHIHITQAIPAHTGLGSGTQLALATATALAKIYNINATTAELSAVMQRAQRTSVGTNIFAKGGFVVDGGKNQKTNAFPPVIYRQPFPTDWRFIIVIPKQDKGLSNKEEKQAFNKLPPMSADDVAHICRLTMLKLLPALAEDDIESFGEALTRIQVLTGKYFSQAQGGGIYSSTIAAQCIEFLKQMGAYGVGQSSWGPTLYAVIKKEQAKPALAKTKQYLITHMGGDAFIAKANNHGATIKIIED